jgi:hypothetical protein
MIKVSRVMKHLILSALLLFALSNCESVVLFALDPLATKDRFERALHERLEKFPERPAHVTVWERGKSHTTDKDVSDKKALRSVAEFLTSKSRVWQASLVTYVPGLSITQDQLNINIQGDRIIVNVPLGHGKNCSQYVSPATPDESAQLARKLGIKTTPSSTPNRD